METSHFDGKIKVINKRGTMKQQVWERRKELSEQIFHTSQDNVEGKKRIQSGEKLSSIIAALPRVNY